MPARARRMTRQPSLDPDEPGSVLVDGGVTSGVPVSPPTPPVSDVDLPEDVVSVCVDWVESDTSEVSVVWVESDTSDVSVVWVVWVVWVDSETLPVSLVIVLVDSVEVDVHVDVVAVDVQPHFGPLCAATDALGMSNAAPSSMTAPSQPRRRIVTVLEWDPPEFLSVMSLSPRVGG